MTPGRGSGEAFCRIKSERSMSATISPPTVQPAFGLGNITWVPRLIRSAASYREACRAQLPRRIFTMFARKGVFSSIGRAAALATVAAVALTAVEPSLALAGSSPAAKGFSAAGASTATDFSARRYYHGGGGGAAAAAAF